jgi:SAM-dependent methyltransferase
MGLHRVIRRDRKKGGPAAPRYMWRLQKNNLIRAANLVGPARKQCPCCGWNGMRFLDYAGHRQNGIICPRCGSHPRHRALWTYLVDQLAGLESGSAVLHLSAEQNLMPIFRRRNDLRYVTSDPKLKSAMVRADATRLRFQSNWFRMIVSSHVLEHLENDRAAIAEFARTLTPGGQAVVMVPSAARLAHGPHAGIRRAGLTGRSLAGVWMRLWAAAASIGTGRSHDTNGRTGVRRSMRTDGRCDLHRLQAFGHRVVISG